MSPLDPLLRGMEGKRFDKEWNPITLLMLPFLRRSHYTLIVRSDVALLASHAIRAAHAHGVPQGGRRAEATAPRGKMLLQAAMKHCVFWAYFLLGRREEPKLAIANKPQRNGVLPAFSCVLKTRKCVSQRDRAGPCEHVGCARQVRYVNTSR